MPTTKLPRLTELTAGRLSSEFTQTFIFLQALNNRLQHSRRVTQLRQFEPGRLRFWFHFHSQLQRSCMLSVSLHSAELTRVNHAAVILSRIKHWRLTQFFLTTLHSLSLFLYHENVQNVVQGNPKFLKFSRGSTSPDPPTSLYLHCPDARPPPPPPPPTKNPGYAPVCYDHVKYYFLTLWTYELLKLFSI